MGDVAAPELLIILAVVLLLFGGAKLPELARSLGKAKNEFQKGVDEGLPAAGTEGPVDTSGSERPAATAAPARADDRPAEPRPG